MGKDEYDAFFKATFKEFLEPLTTSHFNVEGTIEFTAMLFVPGMAPFEQQVQLCALLLHRNQSQSMHFYWILINFVNDFNRQGLDGVPELLCLTCCKCACDHGFCSQDISQSSTDPYTVFGMHTHLPTACIPLWLEQNIINHLVGSFNLLHDFAIAVLDCVRCWFQSQTSKLQGLIGIFSLHTALVSEPDE